ncbi:undecaprenyl-phosphate glucose phosphotransferase [Paraburkholderia rhynchosiae]|uniref:UDP-glucose:undecaprenyl-phosphate glucose-1-phosphate transferase n=1 Tax=Paraburkholderia rhynchosiae TaxID=487049 RepID=A0A2N7WNN8_9BURK|nr:undecaprenyl-phosphate glucose phosphotransferase [Paraburkholderia rhynchosiae]PMS30955.1 undecaprenyl-phosphate glucose phosphotransferase [Paraburkholderia rhynchosiae]CAB3732732.1 UDP-glucose:undecaprenyl-phosphate glucose-1-phosphate transferase [Paraburkholderia rhynchosiae]
MKQAIARFCDTTIIVTGAMLAGKLELHASPSDAPLNFLFCVAITAFAAVVFPMTGVYRSWRARPIRHLLVRLLAAWVSVQLVGLAVLLFIGKPAEISNPWLYRWALITAALLLGARIVAYAGLRRLRLLGVDPRRVAIIGTGVHFHETIDLIDANNCGGFAVADVVMLKGVARYPSAEASQSDKQELAGLLPLISAGEVEEVWIVLPVSSDAVVIRCIETLKHTLVKIRLLPDVRALGLQSACGPLDLMGLSALSVSAPHSASSVLTGKDVFDRLFAACALTALLPVFAAIAVAIKMSSPGSIFFRQRRKGLNGRPFTIYKFRSMRVHAHGGGKLQQATRNDSRVTPVGRFLRRTSLDELPQFINVLRGEMSVVGPRPHALEHDDLYAPLIDGYIDRYRAKPGITGWAQINGHRGETDRLEKMAARVEHDLYYLRNWSFWLDMRIVVTTLFHGFTGSQAY